MITTDHLLLACLVLVGLLILFLIVLIRQQLSIYRELDDLHGKLDDITLPCATCGWPVTTKKPFDYPPKFDGQ